MCKYCYCVYVWLCYDCYYYYYQAVPASTELRLWMSEPVRMGGGQVRCCESGIIIRSYS